MRNLLTACLLLFAVLSLSAQTIMGGVNTQPFQIKIGDDFSNIRDPELVNFAVVNDAEISNILFRLKRERSQILIGNEGGGLAGIAIDAVNGDYQDFDFATLYQYANGEFEIRNASNNNIVININQDDKVTFTPNGDIYMHNPNRGLILTSPNGTCWRFTVDDFGNFLRQPVDCPGQL